MKRAPGHPPLVDDDSSTEVGVTLPTRQFDEYSRRALREGVSVPEIIRRELQEKRRDPE
jgi:LDH2 family malate/lactate/ureidoglycolate dehydrogenase